MNYSHFVGLDVGKNTFDASLMSAEEKELSHKSFDNTPEGIQSMLAWIDNYQLSLSEVLFCAENMGSYVTELSVSSVTMGFSLTLVCPLTIKKSIGLQRGKNDRIDAKRIANYAVLHYRKLKLYKLPMQPIYTIEIRRISLLIGTTRFFTITRKVLTNSHY